MPKQVHDLEGADMLLNDTPAGNIIEDTVYDARPE